MEQLSYPFVSLRIAVVFGNSKANPSAVIRSSANVRHWKSYEPVASNIAEALTALGCRHVTTMPDGADLIERLREHATDLVWLNTGGVQGESPMCHTAAALESAGVPYVGHGPLNAALLDDKGNFKLALVGAGLPTAPFLVWGGSSSGSNPAAEGRTTRPLLDTTSVDFVRVFGSYSGPFIVKPVNGRASQYVEYVEHLSGVPAMVADIGVKTSGGLVMLEAFLPGKEYCVAVCGDGSGGAFAFAAVERCLDADEKVFTSMDTKAITANRVRLLHAATEAPLLESLHDLARRVYAQFNLTSLVRLDIRADASGTLYILEANPKPDLARPSSNSVSIIAAGIEPLGWSYQDLIAFLLVERLATLSRTRPYAVAHFLPQTAAPEALMQMLPLQVLQAIGSELVSVPPAATWWEFEDDEGSELPPVQRGGGRTSRLVLSACSLEVLRIPSLSAGSALRMMRG